MGVGEQHSARLVGKRVELRVVGLLIGRAVEADTPAAVGVSSVMWRGSRNDRPCACGHWFRIVDIFFTLTTKKSRLDQSRYSSALVLYARAAQRRVKFLRLSVRPHATLFGFTICSNGYYI
jgi:hypothetical protein